MGNTLKIRKSKYLSYQKQGFLYLVFILFLFFSQAGEYVTHYMHLAKTQKALNGYLESRLEGLVLEDDASNAYRNDVLQRLEELETINEGFDDYARLSIAGPEQFRENQFAERRVRRGDLGVLFAGLWADQQAQSKGNWTPATLEDYDGRIFNATDYFFKETPNAVVPSLVEHAKTAFLVEALESLNKEALVFEKYRMERLEEANFTSVFKKRLFLGENFEMALRSTDESDSIEVVTINSKVQPLSREDGGTQLFYRPTAWGKYFVEIQTRSQRFYTSFEVVRPRIRFVAQEELIDLTLGQTQSISIDDKLLPTEGFAFESDFATTSYESGVLKVTPSTTGEFTLRLFVGEEPMDSVSMGARAPELLSVMLADASGEAATLATAHRIQSANPAFQVLSYTATFYPQDGSAPKEVQSLSRLLRPEVQDWVSSGAGTLVIKNLSLLSSNGTTRVGAQPLIVATNE